MQKLSTILSIAAVCTTLPAQCFETNLGTLCPTTSGAPGLGDDVLFDLQAMNLSFPMGGVAGSYTHAEVQSNGVIFLTNGAPSGATNTGFANNQSVQIANLRGGPGSAPRIAPFWRDLVFDVANNGGVYFNNTIPGKFVVTWENAIQYNTAGPVFTIQAQLFGNGDVTFYYNANTSSSAPVICGLSQGDAVSALPEVNLSVGGNVSSTRWIHERFGAGTFDLAERCVTFTNNGSGYNQAAVSPASHESYGAACYNIAAETIYQGFAQASSAAAALSGQSMVFTPASNGYTVTWGGASFVAPSGAATPLATGDDGEVGVTPSTALPSPFGAASELRVHGNAIVSLGSTPQTFPGAPNVYTPTAAALRDADLTAFWAWHDYNQTEPGSGAITYDEQVIGDTIALITWDDVESYSVPASINRSTLQFQLNLNTGVVAIVWQTVDSDNSSQYGSGHIVGFSPGGASQQPASIDLATALPITTQPDLLPLTLTASPAPVSTASNGTLVTYTSSNIPEAGPGAGVYVAANILSVAGVPEPGVELTFLGAPGCYAHVLTLTDMTAMFGATSTQSTSFQIPAGVPSGFVLYAQSVALVVPGSLPNGQNSFGLTTSNGLRSTIRNF
jgi:hypothetical protein